MKTRSINIAIIVIIALAIVGIIFGCQSAKTPQQAEAQKVKVVYGISPYQDTILPIVAEKEGWYQQEGLDVQLKVLAWGDVMNAVASGSVDVAIQNFNSFQATYSNIAGQGGDVVFYYPLFVFKGAAIMVKPNSGIKTLQDMLKTNPDRDSAIMSVVNQLKGKTIVTTKGTEMEQIVLAAIKKAGLVEGKDVKIKHAQPDDGLRAFLRGDAQVYSGGVTERTEATKQGAVVMIEAADLTPPVIDGLVTSKKFAQQHNEALLKLIKLWFKTTQFMESDLDNNSKIVTDYLATVGSTHYTAEQYRFTWFNTEVFPKSIQEMDNLLIAPNSPYYWKKSWDGNNAFLLGDKKIPNAVPYDASWIETIDKQYLDKYGAAK